jgi:hypothetical protein
MTTRARVAILVIASAGLVLAFFAARGDDDKADKPASTQSVAQPAPGATATAPPAELETDTAPAEGLPADENVPVVRIAGGKPEGGVAKLEFTKGQRIRFDVESDVADEVHVHGYDVAKPVKAGGKVRFSFDGKIDGRFEVELEGRGIQIAQLDVAP